MKEIKSSEFESEVLNNGIVALDFYSTECPPCEALAPKFETVSDLYGNHVKFLKIYRQDNRELAQQLGVSSSPTVLFFHDGKRVGTMLTGGIKKSELINNLNSLLSPTIVESIEKNMKRIETTVDVVILGGGPAGLTAGIYLAQAKLDTLIVDTSLPGGQVSTTHLVSNYPGFETPTNGYMLAHHITEQAKNTGVKFKPAVDITSVDLINKKIIVDKYETITAKKIIIATGARPRPLGIKGEAEYRGKGLSYCATCDAKYFQDKEVIIIGGGNTAVEESEFISKFASKITMIHQFDKLTSNKEAQEKLFANSKINVLYECEPRAFEKVGDKMKVVFENLKNHESHEIFADGVFIFVGMMPNLEQFKEMLNLDNWGYLKVDEDMKTNIADVYAAGDVISKKYRQITTAVSDGTIASIAISKEFR